MKNPLEMKVSTFDDRMVILIINISKWTFLKLGNPTTPKLVKLLFSRRKP